MPGPSVVKPLTVKAASASALKLKIKCESLTNEPMAVQVLEGDALHDCMRNVKTAVLKFSGSPESHPKVELRVEVLGDVGLEVGETYELVLERMGK